MSAADNAGQADPKCPVCGWVDHAHAPNCPRRSAAQAESAADCDHCETLKDGGPGFCAAHGSRSPAAPTPCPAWKCDHSVKEVTEDGKSCRACTRERDENALPSSGSALEILAGPMSFGEALERVSRGGGRAIVIGGPPENGDVPSSGAGDVLLDDITRATLLLSDLFDDVSEDTKPKPMRRILDAFAAVRREETTKAASLHDAARAVITAWSNDRANSSSDEVTEAMATLADALEAVKGHAT